MTPLLTDQERLKLAAPLGAALRRPITLDGRSFNAVIRAPGSRFVDLGTQALLATLLADPGHAAADPERTEQAVELVIAFASLPSQSRRMATGPFKLHSADPRAFDLETPFHRFTGNLAHGLLLQRLQGSVAGRDGSLMPPLVHSGNLLEFWIDRHFHTVDVEDGIVDCGVEEQGKCVRAWHETRVTGRAGWFRPREVEAGILRLTYMITAQSPVIRLDVEFRATRSVKAMVLSTALDALGEAGLDLAAAEVQTAEGWRSFPPPAAPDQLVWLRDQPAAHLALGRAGWPAEGPVVHLRPGSPQNLHRVTLRAREAGRLHWLTLRHGPVDIAAGTTQLLTEDRYLAANTRPAAAAEAMLAPATPRLLPDAEGPCGAALVAVAAHLLAALRGWSRPEPAALAARREWLARRLAAMAASLGPAIALEEVAQGLLAAGIARRAGLDSAPIAPFAAAILARRQPSGAFGREGLIGHAAALLALGHVGAALPDGPPDALLAAGLSALHLTETDIEVQGGGETPRARLAEGWAMMMRAIAAMPAGQPQADRVAEHAARLLRGLLPAPDALGGSTSAQLALLLASIRHPAWVPELA